MRPLNIILIAAVDLPEGGGETTRLKTLAAAIKAAGHRLQILLENPSGNVDEKMLQVRGEIEPGIPFRYILGNTDRQTGFNFFLSKYTAVKKLLAAIKQAHENHPVDVIWFNMLAYHDMAPITRFARANGIKTIQSYEDDRVNGAGLRRKLIYTNQTMGEKLVSPKADAVVAISHHLKDKFEGYTAGKVPVYIIPTIINADKWYMADEPVNEIPTLLYYGSFFGFDEVEKMIEAIGVLKSRGRKIRLQLVGYNRKRPEYMESVKQLIEKEGLSDTVEMVGFVKHDKLRDYIKSCNVLMGLRKDDEWSSTGLSTKLSEYLATGRAVICSAIGDNVRYLKNGESAVMLRPGCSPQELADEIDRLITDATYRHNIGANGRKVALQNFDTGIVKDRLNKMFADIFPA